MTVGVVIVVADKINIYTEGRRSQSQTGEPSLRFSKISRLPEDHEKERQGLISANCCKLRVGARPNGERTLHKGLMVFEKPYSGLAGAICKCGAFLCIFRVCLLFFFFKFSDWLFFHRFAVSEIFI